MPCRSYDFDPPSREPQVVYRDKPAPDPNIKLSLFLAKILQYVSIQLEIPQHNTVINIVRYNEPEPKAVDSMAIALCKLCGDMTPEQETAIIYNAREPLARQLADWWEHHQVEDAKAQAIEKVRQDEEDKLFSNANISGYERELKIYAESLINKYIKTVRLNRMSNCGGLISELSHRFTMLETAYFTVEEKLDEG